ncbi:MAG: sialidase family protein [Propionibacteriaceae bacterium]|nr:sialidase family protein [Propionibacteriaceae bacterium]
MILARRGEPLPGSAFAAPCYRIPAMALTGSGRIVVAYDVRADHLDLPGEFDIVVRTSDDHGRSWSAPAILRSHEPGHGFGDASLLYDPVTGTLWCWYVGSTGASFWDDGGLELWLARSGDEGQTWTHRQLNLPTDRIEADGPLGAMFASSGHGVAHSSGRLIQPMVFRPARTTDRHAVMAYSDDHGETWELGHPVRDCDENKVAELTDGRLLLHGRANPLRKQAFSSDRGETFTAPRAHPGLPDPSCNGGLARLRDGSLVCTLLDPPQEPLEAGLDPTRGQGAGLAWGRRANLVARFSHDDGQTWSPPTPVWPGEAAYSVALPLGTGEIGVVYERGSYDEIAVTLLPPR